MNNLLTLILSNALALESKVLSPNNTVPWPGNVTNGFTLFLYSASLSDWLGLKDNLVIPKICPLLNPAGENHASLSESVLAITPAVCEQEGM